MQGPHLSPEHWPIRQIVSFSFVADRQPEVLRSAGFRIQCFCVTNNSYVQPIDPCWITGDKSEASMWEETDRSEESHISRIQTRWSIVIEARKLETEKGQLARATLAGHYTGAILGYLTKIVGCPSTAEDLAHEVAILILSGKLAGANPEKGRFRDYLKTVVINTARRYLKEQARQEKRASAQSLEDIEALTQCDDLWTECLRDDLLAQALQDLHDYENTTGKPYASILAWRTSEPLSDSSQLADFLFIKTGSQINSTNARKLLQRAREKLTDFLIQRVRESLPEDRRETCDVDEQLIAVGLRDFCRLPNERASSG